MLVLVMNGLNENGDLLVVFCVICMSLNISFMIDESSISRGSVC